MRVLHVIPSVAPRYGGPSFAVVGFCRALGARGVKTTIATTNADGNGELAVPVGVPTTHEGIDAIFFPRVGEAFKYSPKLARWLRASVDAFDVVHIHAVFSHPSLAAGRACRMHDTPYVVRPLGSLDPWSLTRRAWKKRLLLETSVRALIGHAAAIHFTTGEEQRLAARVAGSAHGVVVAPGVDEECLSVPPLPVEQREPRIVALTRLDPKKRLEALIQAFHAVAGAPDFSEWRLTIAGDGPAEYRVALERLATSGPASSRIDFPGWVEGDQKRQLLRHSAVFALPSHQENFGIALLEAMACGLPAIVSQSVNLSSEVASHGAGWIIGESDESLAAVLRSAMRDTADRGLRSEAARALASRFTWEAAGRELEALYASIAAQTTGARR